MGELPFQVCKFGEIINEVLNVIFEPHGYERAEDKMVVYLI
jgi:hypothetical protein